MTVAIPENTQALIFDCDGTLADTMSIHLSAWHSSLAEHRITCSSEFLEQFNGRPTAAIVQEINKTFNASLCPQTFAAIKDERAFKQLKYAKPIAPVANVAKEWRGKLPMAVISGSCRRNVHAALEAIDIIDYFNPILTADDSFPSKPAPDVFLAAANQLGVDPQQCHVFEDGDLGIEAAVSAGMTFTDVRTLFNC